MSATVLFDTSNSINWNDAPVTSWDIGLTTSGANRRALLFVNCSAAVTGISGGGGTWTRLDNSISGFELWTAPISSRQTGATVTISFAGGGAGTIFASLDTYYIASAATIPSVDAVHASAFSSGTTTPSGSVTTASAGTTVLCYISASSDPADNHCAAGSGYTLAVDYTFAPGATLGMEIATSDTATSGTTVTPGFTFHQNATGTLIAVSLLGATDLHLSETGGGGTGESLLLAAVVSVQETGGGTGDSVSVSASYLPFAEAGGGTGESVSLVAAPDAQGEPSGATSSDSVSTAVSPDVGTVFQAPIPASSISVFVTQDVTIAEDPIDSATVSAQRAIGGAPDGIQEQTGETTGDSTDFPAVSIGPEDGVFEDGSTFGADTITITLDDGTVVVPFRGEVGFSSTSDAVSVAVTTPAAPTPVTGLAAANVPGSPGNVTLSWNAYGMGLSPDHLNVYLNGAAAPAATVSGTLTSVTLTGLTVGHVATFEVAAAAADNTESARRRVSLLIQDATVPAAPASLTAIAGVSSATLTWPAASASPIAPDVYDIYVGDTTLVRSVAVSSFPAGSTSFTATISGLHPLFTYSFTVRSRVSSTGAQSSDSPAATVTPLVPSEGFMTPANLDLILDAVAKQYLIILGDGVHYGVGNDNSDISTDYGQSKNVRLLMIDIMQTEDESIVFGIGPAIKTLRAQTTNAIEVRAKLGPVFSAINTTAQSLGLTGVAKMDDLLTLYNLGSTLTNAWSALVPQPLAAAYAVAMTTSLSARNVYADPGTTLASRTVGSAMTPGTSLDLTAVAGCGGVAAVVSGWTGSGSSSVTVTGTALQTDGAGNVSTVSGATWSGLISGNGTVTLTPTNASQILQSVTAITMPSSMSGGTIAIQTAVPAGRTYPTP